MPHVLRPPNTHYGASTAHAGVLKQRDLATGGVLQRHPTRAVLQQHPTRGVLQQHPTRDVHSCGIHVDTRRSSHSQRDVDAGSSRRANTEVRSPVLQSYSAAACDPFTPEAFAMTPSLKASATQSRLRSTHKAPTREAHKHRRSTSKHKTPTKRPGADAQPKIKKAPEQPIDVARRAPKAKPRSRITANRHAFAAHVKVTVQNITKATQSQQRNEKMLDRASSTTAKMADRVAKMIGQASSSTAKMPDRAISSTSARTPKMAAGKSTNTPKVVDSTSARTPKMVDSMSACPSPKVVGRTLSSAQVEELKNAFASSQRTLADTRRQLRTALDAIDQAEERLKSQVGALLGGHARGCEGASRANNGVFEHAPPHDTAKVSKHERQFKKRKKEDGPRELGASGLHAPKRTRSASIKAPQVCSPRKRHRKDAKIAPLTNLFDSL